MEIVVRSFTESRFQAIVNATNKLINLLGNQFFPLQPPTLSYDTLGATYHTTNSIFCARMKHITIDFHFILDQVANGLLDIWLMSTKNQIADVMTVA